MVGEEVHVLEVLARTSRPLIGIVRAHGRYPYVDSLSPDYRGRISLTNPEAAAQDGETVAVEVVGDCAGDEGFADGSAGGGDKE